MDEWVIGLYGLSQRDMQVILDTLEFNLPFAENKRNAQQYRLRATGNGSARSFLMN